MRKITKIFHRGADMPLRKSTAPTECQVMCRQWGVSPWIPPSEEYIWAARNQAWEVLEPQNILVTLDGISGALGTLKQPSPWAHDSRAVFHPLGFVPEPSKHCSFTTDSPKLFPSYTGLSGPKKGSFLKWSLRGGMGTDTSSLVPTLPPSYSPY